MGSKNLNSLRKALTKNPLLVYGLFPALLVWPLLTIIPENFLSFLQAVFIAYAILYIPYSIRAIRAALPPSKKISTKISWFLYVIYSGLTIFGGLLMACGLALKSMDVFYSSGLLVVIAAIIVSIFLTSACVLFDPLKPISRGKK